MQPFPTGPLEVFRSAWRHRGLVMSLVRRDVLGRYRGSVMGVLWSFFNPLFMLAVYTFVFSVVFGARWGGGAHSRTDFALVIFAGLLVFNVFAECVTRAPTLVLANPNYVKKIVFPLEILPWVALGSALFHAAVSLAVWFLGFAFTRGVPPVTALVLPLVMAPLVLLVLGLTWLLAALGVYVRDISQVVGILTTTLLFLTPIFYPIEALPEHYRGWLLANPMAVIIEQTRGVLYWGRMPDPGSVAVNLVVSASVAWLGFAWFQKTRRGFADVL
jgi:lipopolysaccharide transport system permease protein